MTTSRAWIGGGAGVATLVALTGCMDGESRSVTPLVITSDNAAAAAASAADAGTVTAGAGGGSGGVLAAGLGAAPSDPAVGTRFGLLRFTRKHLQNGFAAPAAAATPASALISSPNQPCEQSGRVSSTLDDRDDNGQLSIDDTLTLSFDQCSDESGVTLNGNMVLTVHALIGEPALQTDWWLTASLALEQLRITAAGEEWTLNGGTVYTSSTRGTNSDSSLSGPSLTMAGTRDSIVLGNFIYHYSEDSNTLVYTFHGRGALESSRLNGSFNFESLQRFQGIADASPTSGNMKLIGANRSSATFTALGGDNVRLAVDADGDGAAEDIIDTTWAALAD